MKSNNCQEALRLGNANINNIHWIVYFCYKAINAWAYLHTNKVHFMEYAWLIINHQLRHKIYSCYSIGCVTATHFHTHTTKKTTTSTTTPSLTSFTIDKVAHTITSRTVTSLLLFFCYNYWRFGQKYSGNAVLSILSTYLTVLSN